MMPTGYAPSVPARIRSKIHRQGKEVLVAASDADLVGRTFEEGEFQLFVAEGFYGGDEDEVSERVLVMALRTCSIANLVGETVVAIAVRCGLVDRANVITIGGVPHAQVVAL